MSCMFFASDNSRKGRIQTFPLRQQLLQHFAAIGRQEIETLVALVLFAPFAAKEALRLQAAEKGIQRALFDLHPMFRQSLTEGVAVLLGPKLGQDSENQGAAPKLRSEIVED